MILSTPISLLGFDAKTSLLSELRHAVQMIVATDPSFDSFRKIRVRSVSIFAIVHGLNWTSSCLRDCLLACGLPISVEERPNMALLTARKYLEFRATLPPAIDQTGFKVCTWNVTSISLKDLTHSGKVSFLRQHGSDQLISLQETKMTCEDAGALQLLLPHVAVVSTPAIIVPADISVTPPRKESRTGGVALCVPTYKYGNAFESAVIVPGYAIAVTLPVCGYPLLVVNAYFPPRLEVAHLSQLKSFCRKLLAQAKQYFAGT